MSDGSPERDESDGSIDEYVFTCPACGQKITVNEEMRRAICANGCPVCASPVGAECFEK